MVLNVLCKHANLKTFVNGLALHQLQYKTHVSDILIPKKDQVSENIVFKCKLEWWIIVMLLISMLRVTEIFILKVMKLMIRKGYLFSNDSNLMLFMSDINRCVPI